MKGTLRSKALMGLVLASACYPLSASRGAALSIATGLSARFGGLLAGNDVARDFQSVGTALSPPLALLLGQLILTGCALRGGRAGMAGVIGLMALGAVFALGQLGEPIVRQAFRPGRHSMRRRRR